MNNFNVRLNKKEQLLLFKRLSMFTAAGTPLPQTLSLMKQGHWSKKMSRFINHLIITVHSGKQLSEGFEQYKKSFQFIIIQAIRIGEKSGTLLASYLYISEELEKQRRMRGKIITALLYPTIIAIATLSVIGTILFYVFPKIIPVFTSLRVPLPFTTKALLALSGLVNHHWLLLSVTLIAVTMITYGLSRMHWLSDRIDKVLLYIPFCNTLIRYYTLAKISRTLGHLINNHIPIMQAVSITHQGITHAVYRAQLTQMEHDLKEGRELSYSLKQYPLLYPAIMISLITAGERTGTLSESLLYLAELCDQELAESMDRMTILVEPLLMIIIGIIVGGIALSIITPLYGITQHITP